MVHFDASPGAKARLRLAAGLADLFKAALIGIAGPPYLPASAGGIPEALASIEKEFRANAHPVAGIEWRGRPVWSNVLIPHQARAADLVILGPRSSRWDFADSQGAGVTILAAGRPVLFVPGHIDVLEAKRVVVAWKDSREARRAIRDALPFLRSAERVEIVEVNEQRPRMRGAADDVADYLSRHRVSVGSKAYLKADGPVASEIIRFTQEEKADLIVAGAYGHSRFGEWVFGGVTRDLLAGTPVCCLFSH
jgi:nucleotide-binding universal stress UspA family protein